eukprot:TRINITY_DN394_c0_g1_i1.p1 TRINITY_DN394_c0_g1~~TRINITY_DN394_c0_g1_i1.p1  ORF type:complete len:460 (+),score=143.11 TRINITY_DN394_c0_g1_i1:50-1381(+)
MDKLANVVVLGGSAAGVVAAITARRFYSDKTVLLVRKEEKVPIPCGIPYVFGTVHEFAKNLIPDAVLEKNNVELLIANATRIDRKKKVLVTTKGDVRYEKLILATGSQPIRVPIPGSDQSHVHLIAKDIPVLSKTLEAVKSAKTIVVIGGGFIGIEFADEIRKLGKDVTVVEILPHCLGLAYDAEFCEGMEKHLKERGIKLMTGKKVEKIGEKEVVLGDGSVIPAELVILGVGARAETTLAQEAGLDIGPTHAIAVDRFMQVTNDEDIFACGDCAEKTSFFSGRPVDLKLASIATLEARIAGANLFHKTRENPGTIGVWGTAVGEIGMGTAGLTESMAKKCGYDYVATTVEGPNRHPMGMPGMKPTKVKLLFDKHNSVILGGQVVSDWCAGEVANMISACIQKKMTADEVATFQLGTHPGMTASPIAYHLVNAAELAIQQLAK